MSHPFPSHLAKISSVVAACLLALPMADAGEKENKPQTWDEFMTVDTQVPLQDLAPLPDADERRKAFENRNSPENIEKLAKQLFAYWDLEEKHVSLNKETRRLEPEKANVLKLYNENKYDAALIAYRDYLIHKVQILWGANPDAYIAIPYSDRYNGRLNTAHYTDTVALLMKGGAYQMRVTKETVRLGEPGLVHWDWQSKGEHNPWDNLAKPEIEYFCPSDFDQLWWNYTDTNDRKYLDRWQAYLDDYLLNHHLQENLSSLNLDLGKWGEHEATAFFFALFQLSLGSNSADAISAPTVARMMLRLVEIDLPQSLYYNRQQSNNHSPETTANMLRISDFVYDFKLGKTLLSESRRQFETFGTVEGRPDGAGPGRLPGYAAFEYRQNVETLKFIQAGRFDFCTPMQNREYRDRMVARERFLLHMFAPTGELILTQKNDRTLSPIEDELWYFNTYYPQIFDDPDMSRIANQIVTNMTRPNWVGKVPIAPEKPMASTGMGTKKEGEPTYTSYSYPYDRIHVMSSGWDPNNDQYGVFLGTSFPGRGDSFMKENKGTNHLNISAFNKDFFCNGVDYAYNYLSSPMLVDGQQQYNGAGEGPTSRRAMGNFGLEPICHDRIHYSENVDLAEGTYAGAYATTGDHNPEFYDYKTKLDALKRSIWGVSHHRVVEFVKKHGVWVVTDLMTSDQPREYSQQWWSWLRNDHSPDGFLVNEIKADNEAKTIKSSIADQPNYSMYHVGPTDLDANQQKAPELKYDPIGLKPKPDDHTKGMRLDRHPGIEFIQLRGTWKSEGGRSQLITVIYPRRTLDDDLDTMTYLKRKDGQVNGFVAKLKDGAEIAYTASLQKPEPLQIKGISAVAESLLVLSDTDGKVSGTVLGCSKISGRHLTQISSDFEFAVSGSTVESRPIYRPIEPVEIEPGINAFTDKIEVTLKTPTEGTEIHYTVDGLDPTLESPVYTGPLLFTDTVMVKARAFRKGIKKMPPLTETGTEMTGVGYAVYTKVGYHEANRSAKELKPGLDYAYYEAKWPFLLFGASPMLKPVKNGAVSALFDTSPKGVNQNKAFAFDYKGYINVPADGVYTLYAPREFVVYRPLAGYDLKVELGYQIQSDNGKLRPVTSNSPLEEWYPATRRHAFGTWSVALKKGLQPLHIYYADTQCEYPGWNVPGLTKIVWDGDVPQLEISGPGLFRQTIPTDWYRHD
jgi:hypothetical protein